MEKFLNRPIDELQAKANQWMCVPDAYAWTIFACFASAPRQRCLLFWTIPNWFFDQTFSALPEFPAHVCTYHVVSGGTVVSIIVMRFSRSLPYFTLFSIYYGIYETAVFF